MAVGAAEPSLRLPIGKPEIGDDQHEDHREERDADRGTHPELAARAERSEEHVDGEDLGRAGGDGTREAS